MKASSFVCSLLLATGGISSTQGALVALYQFDSAGTSQADASGNGNTATSLNGATQVFDGTRSSGAMSFDGNDDYLTVADSASLSITGNITIALWSNLSSIGPFGQWRGLVTKDAPGSGTAAPYQFWFNQNDGAPIYVGGNGTANDIANTSGPTLPTVGVWEHWAVTMSGNSVQIYRNGVALPMGDATISTSPLADGNGSVFIGNRDGAQDMSYFGRMDDVAIFDQALTLTQIQTIMTGDFSAFGVGVPEPSRFLLLGLASTGLVLRRKRGTARSF